MTRGPRVSVGQSERAAGLAERGKVLGPAGSLAEWLFYVFFSFSLDLCFCF